MTTRRQLPGRDAPTNRSLPVAVSAIGCFKCVSLNVSDPDCDDQFHNNNTGLQDMVGEGVIWYGGMESWFRES